MQKLTKWHDWEITGFLGRGSYGEVYQIERTAFGHTYKSALKVIRIPKDPQDIESVIGTGMTESDAKEYFHDMAESIASEFALMSELRGNSNIVSFEDFEVVPEDDGYSQTLYIRMELLEPLIQYMKENRMTKQNVIEVGCDILKALEQCEKKNIIHRDIKPENVFRSEQGTFKLGDFGIARELDRSETGMSQKGTTSYMAPEVYRGIAYDNKVDIYSLGIMLYRLMNNNRLPFLPPYPEKIKYSDTEQANLRRMTGEELPLPCNAQDDLGRVILKACKFDPEERYSSAADMRRDLEIYLAEGAALIPEDNIEDDEDLTVGYPISEAIADTARDNRPLNKVEAEKAGQIKEQIKKEKKENKKAKENNKERKKKSGERKKASKGKIAGIAAIAAVLLLVIIVIAGAYKGGTITVAGREFNKDTAVAWFYKDEITVEEIQKLDQFPNLREIEIKNCNLTNDDIAAIGSVKTGVTRLILHNCHGFDDITPLADMQYLGFLNMSNCDITDDMLEATDFSKMQHLVALRLQGNSDVTDLKYIQAVIPQLQALSISKTDVTDVSALKDAGELNMLLAADCSIEDISALKCPKMQYVNLERNKISDISVMKNMPDLWVIKMSDNNVSDLTPLTGLQDLDTASFNGNAISDLTPLAECPHLSTLQVCGNEIETLEGLSGHDALIELYANDNKITSLKGIEHELELNCLAVARNELTNLEGAENLTKLIRANYEGNSIDDFSLLAKSSETMQWVILNDNPAGSIDVLKDMHDLQGVYCDNTGISSMDVLSDKDHLIAVSAENNSLTSIKALEGKKELETIDISGNKIKDISPVSSVYHDDYVSVVLDARNNEIKSIVFPDCDRLVSKSYIAITGNPVKGADLISTQESESTCCEFLSMDYYDGMENGAWIEKLESGTVLQIVGCPLDRQAALKDKLNGAVLEEYINFVDEDDSDSVMEPLLYEKKCHDSTVEIDTKYGKNAQISEDEEEKEIDEISDRVKDK